MLDYITIGSSPWEEPCVQVSDVRDYITAMHVEVIAFKHQLQRAYPCVTFATKTFRHDFGPYIEVVALYTEGNEAEKAAALDVEDMPPASWDEAASLELSSSPNWLAYWQSVWDHWSHDRSYPTPFPLSPNGEELGEELGEEE